MATGLTKRKGSNFYHYAFKIKGNLYRGSTYCEDLASAKLYLHRIRNQILLGEYAPKKETLFKDLVKKWMESQKEGNHKNTCEYNYRLHLKQWDNKTLDKITTEVVLDMRKKYLENHSEASANLLLRVLNLFFGFAVDCKMIKEKSYSVKQIKIEQKIRPILELDSIESFYTKMSQQDNSLQLLAMAKIAVTMGLRESEILGMKWDYLDEVNSKYLVTDTKSHKPRMLSVLPETMIEIQKQSRTVSGLIFPSKKHGKQHPRGYLYHVIVKVTKELGSQIGVHRLRATFATLLGRLNTPIKDVQEMLGHATIATTIKYQEQDLTRQQEAMERLQGAIKKASKIS